MAADRTDHLLSLWGHWYNDNIYYRYNLAARSKSQRWVFRLLLLPMAMVVKAYRKISHQFELMRVEMPITTRCTLRCKDCCNLIPFYVNPADIDIALLIQDIDDFLSNVDRVYRFVIMGGEAFLHPDLNKLLTYLIRNRKINIVQVFTNATVIPAEDILELLQNRKVFITISDYPIEVARRKNQFIAVLTQRQIHYTISATNWNDMGGLNPPTESNPLVLKNRFANCSRKICHNLMDGEYHLCARSGHGQQLGQFPRDPSDSVHFRGRHDPPGFQNELRQLLRKEYISACTKCNGDAGQEISPAIQLHR
ncbi:MAG: radical SAM protein [Syntrophomonadaceae bacterium]